MGEFRLRDEKLVHQGSVVSFAVGTYVAPDGTTFERDVVHHPGAVSVVPLLDDGTVVMVRQYRAPIDQPLLEIPAGKRDVDGEPPEVTAAREVEEEIGLIPARLELLATFYNSPGFSDEHSYVYLGTGLTDGTLDRHGVEELALTVEHVPLDDVAGMIADGRITDAKSIIGLTLALRHLGR